jgi:hypothetical protein
LEVYDINNNQITGAAFIGTVGLDWQFAGIAPIHAAGASDLVLRNVNTGAFEVYDIANNQLTGAASLGRSAWIGKPVVSRPIRRPAPRVPQVLKVACTRRPRSLCRRWQDSLRGLQ